MAAQEAPPLWAAADSNWVAADRVADAGGEAETPFDVDTEEEQAAESDDAKVEGRAAQQGDSEKEQRRGDHEAQSEDVWYMHRTLPHWLYNPREGVYFNRTTGDIVLPSTGEATEANAPVGAVAQIHESRGESAEGEEGEGAEEGEEGEEGVEGEEGEAEDDLQEEEEDEDIDLDLETDVVAGTAERKGSAEGKVEIEDRHVTKVSLPVQVVTGDENTLCYYTAIFDGHDGSSCAQYATVNLHKNLISLYRQIYSTVQRRRQQLEDREMERERGDKKRKKKPSNFSLLVQQLNDGLPSKRREEKFLSVGLEALVKATAKSFFMTDHNFLDSARKSGVEQDAGSTACVVLLFGPDDDGQLKLLTAHAGDTRAVLCRDDRALRLTEDHRPNHKLEQRRVQQNGGEVMNIEGVWRVIFVDRKTNRLFGLATSRALGDRRMKVPKKLVTCQPTLHVYAINFETDLFLVLASDGIWDVLSDEEVVAIVSEHLDKPPQEAARFVIDEAVKRGSEDDKTCTVLFFKWRRDRFPSAADAAAASGGTASEAGEKVQEDEEPGDMRRDRGGEAATRGNASGEKAETDAGAQTRLRQRGDEAREDEAPSGAGGEKRRKRLRTQGGISEAGDPASDEEEQGGSRQPEDASHAQREGGDQTEKAGDSFKAGRGLEDIGLLSSSDVYARIRRAREEREKQEEVENATGEEVEDDLDIFSA
uniref:Protein phosphatase 2C domain-containing protein n=1 Tax=Toxoplasma gondii COUG TaxID=1074873 RepID=A0A2G8XU62_TOXGO|nr:protein phosphatase 2C domain-containing protein [Toxoplasma gondii COUG]